MHQESLLVPCRGHRPHPEAVIAAFALGQAFQLAQRTLHVGVVDRFEQVVDAVDLERPHGVIVICGGHDDPRRHIRLAEYLEAIPVGELHVHENHIGTVPRRAQPEHRLPDRAGRPDDPYVGKMLGQRSRQVCLGHHFVFYDQYVHITATVR